MIKPLVIPALAALLACIPGKILFGQKIVLTTEDDRGHVIDMSVTPCKTEPISIFLAGGDGKMRSQPIAMFRSTLYFISTGNGIQLRTEHANNRVTSRGLGGGPNGTGDNTSTLTVNRTGIMYWVNHLNQLVWSSTNFNPAQGILGTVPFKANGDLVFYKDKLYLTAEGGVVEVDIDNPANSKMIIPTPGRVFPGLINVPVGCTGNKVYGVEAVGTTTNLVEFDLEQNRILGVYCSFDLGSKVSDAASPGETGQLPYIGTNTLYFRTACLPDTVNNEFGVDAYTAAGDSGLSYTFTKGQIVKGPYQPQRGELLLKGEIGAGQWNLRIKSSSGCILDTLITITQPIELKAEVETKPDSCGTNTGQAFIKMNTGEAPFEWEVEGLPRQSTSYFFSMPSGDYKLNIKDRNSCSTSMRFSIGTYTPPMPIRNIEVVPIKTCERGGEIKLTLDSSSNVTGVLLDNEDMGNQTHFTDLRAGARLLQVKVGSCIFDTLITIPVLPGKTPSVTFNNKNADCNGSGGSSSIQVTNISTPFTVSFNGGSFTSDLQFNNLAPGIYLVLVKDARGCEWPFSDTIRPHTTAAPPVIDSVVTENRCVGVGNIRLVITGTEMPYRFQVDGAMYNSGIRTVDLAAGTYPAVIYNATRCALDTLQFTIRGKENCDTIRALFIPSAFTPNGDGKNDILMPHTNPAGKVVRFVFRVYNRNGQAVFESRSPNNGWDGKYKGLQQPAATYVWVFEGTDVDGKPVNFKGTTVLIR